MGKNLTFWFWCKAQRLGLEPVNFIVEWATKVIVTVAWRSPNQKKRDAKRCLGWWCKERIRRERVIEQNPEHPPSLLPTIESPWNVATRGQLLSPHDAFSECVATWSRNKGTLISFKFFPYFIAFSCWLKLNMDRVSLYFMRLDFKTMMSTHYIQTLCWMMHDLLILIFFSPRWPMTI